MGSMGRSASAGISNLSLEPRMAECVFCIVSGGLRIWKD